MNGWLWAMFAACVAGSLAGIFYPTFLRLFVDAKPLVELDATTGRWLTFIGLGLVIALITATLGFAAFLGNAAHQAELRALGVLAYFTAFTAGYTTSSVATEPLKQG